jgi:myosin protein heavy chain
MSLEVQKRKVEEELAAERSLALDKDVLLERSKRREAELAEEVALLQADLETLDSQLDRAMKIQKESDEKYETLRQAFEEATGHLVRLESAQKEWASQEARLTMELKGRGGEAISLQAEKENLRKMNEELKNSVSQRDEDLTRIKERKALEISDLNSKLAAEQRQRSTFQFDNLLYNSFYFSQGRL